MNGTGSNAKPKRWLQFSLAILFLLAIAIVSVGVLIWSWPEQDANQRLEVAKAALQVLGVGILGGLAAASFALIQQIRADQEKARDERRKDAQKELNERAEQWQREGEALRSLAAETIAAYNELKSIRRLIRVAIESKNEPDYQQHMRRFSLVELEFERFRRTVPFSSFARDPIQTYYLHESSEGAVTKEPVTKTVPALSRDYSEIENFLGGSITAFERNSRRPDQTPKPSSDPNGKPDLGDFLDRVKFRNGVTKYVNVILEVLLRARLSPLPDDLVVPPAPDRPAPSPADGALAGGGLADVTGPDSSAPAD